MPKIKNDEACRNNNNDDTYNHADDDDGDNDEDVGDKLGELHCKV